MIDKPEGITTHQSHPNDWGIVEFIAYQKDIPLYVVHRLDKETSGALLVARDRETAKNLSALFEKKQVSKKYLFLTDRPAHFKTASHQSFIDKTKDTFTSEKNVKPNSFTDFSWIWSDGSVHLWQASPISGKPHQIRLHAQDLGIPLLGDTEHGGTIWARLALNAQEIFFKEQDQSFSFSSLSPWWADKQFAGLIQKSLSDPEDLILVQLKNAFEKRQRLKLTDLPSYRLSHEESEHFSVDIYGNQAWVNWYKDQAPTLKEIQNFEFFFQPFGQSVFLRRMNNRGQDPNSNQFWTIGAVIPEWWSKENHLKFELKTTQGLSAGLFLDQRANRAWVKKNSSDRKVLNLYSYTCGFSLAAAAGNANEVCSVDVSSKFLDWGKRNFQQNDLNPENYEFWAQDCVLFLKGAVKRQRRFDLIIADPPSFGRSKDSVFRIEKDWPELLDLCLSVLNPGGKILFSTNYEKWDYQDFENRMKEWAKTKPLELKPAPAPELDFELSSLKRLLKSIVIEKRS